MKYNIAVICSVAIMSATVSMAESPIPTFDKETVTIHPYHRTGDQDKTIDIDSIGSSHDGNTGTASHPAFYVQKIILDSTTPKPKDTTGTLQHILDAYSHRNLSVDELSKLIADVTEYYRAASGHSATRSRKRHTEDACLYSEI